jgi:hypothetical protein
MKNTMSEQDVRDLNLLDIAKDQLRQELDCLIVSDAMPAALAQALLQQTQVKQRKRFGFFERCKVWLSSITWQTSIGFAVSAALVVMVMMPQYSAVQLMPDTHAIVQFEIPFTVINEEQMNLQANDLRLIETSVANRDLIALGVAVNPQDFADTSQAQWLVGRNDEPLAVRILMN